MRKIRYIQHEEIDKEKWDLCIEAAENSLIYGYTWWLDRVSPGWHALVFNDYEAVMPLTWRKKYGIYYLYQPFFTAALGVFYKHGIGMTVMDFFNAVPPVFKYWDIDINEKNIIERNTIITYQRVNQMLSLTQKYDGIREGYSRLAKRKLTKATENNMVAIKGIEPKMIVDLYKNEYKHFHKTSLHDFAALKKSCEIAVDKEMAETYIVQSHEGKPISFYIVLLDKNFVYSLLGGSSAEGKTEGAFYLLTDAVIKDYSGSGKTLRFEGSDKEGIAFFNSQFGAVSVPYLHLKENRLPFPLKLFKD